MATFKTRKFCLLAGSILAFSTMQAHAEIVIGASLGMTGQASFLGDPAAKTLRMLVDEVNEKGGIHGEKIKLIIYDDGNVPSNSRTFATRLIEEDQILAAIGPSSTGTTLAVMQMFEDAEIPLISIGAGVAIIDPVKPYIFKSAETDIMACNRIFEDALKRGFTTMALISSNGGIGASMRGQCKKIAAEKNITIAADEVYEDADVDMTPQLTRIRGLKDVQAIANPGFGHSSAVVQRNYAQLGIKTPFYQSHGVASDEFLKLAGAAAEGIRLPAPALVVADLLPDSDPQRDVALTFKTAYEAKYKESVSSFAGYTRDAFAILVGAIERAGKGATPQQVRDEIEKTSNLPTTTGIVTMSATDHMGLGDTALRMIQVKDGKWALLDD